MSAPPGARPGHANGQSSSHPSSRTGSPAPRGRTPQSGLGPKPQLDEAKIQKILDAKYGLSAVAPCRYGFDLTHRPQNNYRCYRFSPSRRLSRTYTRRRAIRQRCSHTCCKRATRCSTTRRCTTSLSASSLWMPRRRRSGRAAWVGARHDVAVRTNSLLSDIRYYAYSSQM
jgi:hypothetical protein